MYKLNEEKITKARAEELITDLAMFPLDSADLELSSEDRVKKYTTILNDSKKLKLSDTLILSIDL